MKNLMTGLVVVMTILFSCNNTRNQELFADNVSSAASLYESMVSNRQWPSYRGYFANGFLDNTDLPDSFNIESAYNVKWNVEIPGLGAILSGDMG